MTQSKKKVSRGDLIDRISDLPRNAINGILERLNVVDLVRTSILSRKWRYMWTSVPQLKFKRKFFTKYEHLEDLKISSIITDVLSVHNGPVYKFTLYIPYDLTYMINIEYLDKWILLLSRSGIKYLEVVNEGAVPNDMPSHVFSCNELTNFKFFGFNLSLPSNFCGFRSLLNLHLSYISFESGSLESLISSCPLLEELLISYCFGFECIDFSSPTLKVLRIDFGQDIKPICLAKAESLNDLTLTTYPENDEKSKISDLIKSLPKIKTLTLGSGYNKILSADAIPQMLQMTFNSLNYLKLSLANMNKRELLYIVSVLKSASNLMQLVIKSYDHVRDIEVFDISDELECNCLSQLQTVNIEVGTSVLYAMRLIRFILANSPSLETLTFDVDLGYKQSTAHTLVCVSQELLRMERASKRARVLFIHREMFNRECV